MKLYRIAEAEKIFQLFANFFGSFLDRHDLSDFQKLKGSFKNDKQLWKEEFEMLVAGLRKKMDLIGLCLTCLLRRRNGKISEKINPWKLVVKSRNSFIQAMVI